MKRTRKIKVLEAIRQGQVGGGETHVLDLVSKMDRSIFEPVVLSFTDGPMVETLKNKGIKTQVIHTEQAFDYQVWNKVSQLINDENIDIVHAHGTRANSNVFWAARKCNLPLMYTVHGWSFHIDQQFVVRKLRELSENFLTRMAQRTICVSQSNEFDGIKRFNMQRSKVIYNAVNMEKFNPDAETKDIRKHLNIDEDALVIGYIARITKQKDPFTMTKAFKQVLENKPNAVLLMVGDGELKDDTIQLAKELKIEKNIIFQPFRNDIPDVLKSIDIYCLPSLWEGFPIGILEAMAMKKAVIASSVDGMKELIQHNQSGILVPHSNEKILAEEITKLLNNTELRKELAHNAYHYVKANFGIGRLVNQVQSEYFNLIN
ncbi:MAG: glycosyltransferase family 4 protein [Bacteroidales bacterium]|nr:glycosyltransferase family 4 protein [Bacteroidales bacterium]